MNFYTFVLVAGTGKGLHLVNGTATSKARRAMAQNCFVINVNPMGNIGNRMLQYMAALKLAVEIPGSKISNVSLREWGIQHPLIEQGEVATERFIDQRNMRIDIAELILKISKQGVQRYELGTFAQDLHNFLEVDQYREVFIAPQTFPGFGEDYLVCNIRGAEILAGGTSFYTTIPPEFYRHLTKMTGLKPVFMGQIGNDSYSNTLRQYFPRAQFLSSLGPIADFETIRNSKNVVVSVSTFSWLAAWLSRATKIFVPISGFYNVSHFPEINLLPLDDNRYTYFLFPHHVAAPLDRLEESHNALNGLWRQVTTDMIASYRKAFPRFQRSKHTMLEMFDELFYLAKYEDVRREFRRGVDHYYHHGFAEGRDPFELDPVWYQVQYPMAAIEVGQGDFYGFHHHYVSVGRSRGYHPHRMGGA